MIVVTCFALSVAPMIEGMMTSLLMEDAMAMMNHVPGAHVEFDRVIHIMVMLFGHLFIKDNISVYHNYSLDKFYSKNYA